MKRRPESDGTDVPRERQSEPVGLRAFRWMGFRSDASVVWFASKRSGVGVVALGGASVDETGAFSFSWNAEPESIFKGQRRDRFAAEAVWVTVGPVHLIRLGPIRWSAPERIKTVGFYRVVLPGPELFGVEPAIVSTAPARRIYVLGQQLNTNHFVGIGGVAQTSLSFEGQGRALTI